MGFFKDIKDLSKTGKDMQKQQYGTNNPFSVMKQGVAQAKEAVGQVQGDQAKMQQLMANGVQGQATVKSLQDTGMMVNNMPQIQMELSVVVPGQEAYDVTHTQVLAHSALGSMQPGATVAVRVDPNDPSSLMIG